MKILDVLDNRLILLEKGFRTKKGVLRELVHSLPQLEKQFHEDLLVEILLEWESLGSNDQASYRKGKRSSEYGGDD